MAWWKLGRARQELQKDVAAVRRRESMAPNPHLNSRVRSDGFFSADVGRLLAGWDSYTHSIDYYLESELRQLRARSREAVRRSSYGKRYIRLMRNNIVGPSGVTLQAQSKRMVNGVEQLDSLANTAIEAAWREWCKSHCNYLGGMDFVQMQLLAVATAAQDGEFLFRKRRGAGAGPYGFQLEPIDPELLDISKNTKTGRNGRIRLGVEYDKAGRVIRYHFRERNPDGDYAGGYTNGKHWSIAASEIIHGFLPEWPDQSRGVPWMHAALEDMKHLSKYNESALVKARSTASTMAVLRSDGSEPYTGDEDGDGEHEDATLDQFEAGTIKDIGNRHIESLDSDYPHQMYAPFVKAHLQKAASGLGVSYHSLTNDLEGVNYSSIRAGVLEDREAFKELQNWFIAAFVRPVYEEWLSFALMNGMIRIGRRRLSRSYQDYVPAHFQGRRWAWVDPQKDGAANEMAIQNNLKSRGQIMREQGDDPDSVWQEIAREREMMESLGITPLPAPQQQQDQTQESSDDA